jgi:hypothetical protein
LIFEMITSVTFEPGGSPGRSACTTWPRLPPSNNGTASPTILARSLERCQALSSSCERKFRTIVHSLLSGREGGMTSLLMKPGNLPMTMLCRACQAAKAWSSPERSLAVAMRTAGALI